MSADAKAKTSATATAPAPAVTYEFPEIVATLMMTLMVHPDKGWGAPTTACPCAVHKLVPNQWTGSSEYGKFGVMQLTCHTCNAELEDLSKAFAAHWMTRVRSLTYYRDHAPIPEHGPKPANVFVCGKCVQKLSWRK